MTIRENLISEIENLRKNISTRLEMLDSGKLREPKEIEFTQQLIEKFTNK